MRKKLTLSLVLVGMMTNSFASTNEAWKNINENRNATINIYGVGAKVDASHDSSAGFGLMFDSEAIKVKAEGTSDFFRTGAVLKVNPFTQNLYFKFGLNYLNQKVFSPVNTSTRVNQYSAAFATGYMLRDDFYAEIGGSHTKLNGKVFGDYEIKDEKTSIGYIELAKRWESSFGTIDTTANAGQVFYEYKDNESSYGLGVDYYPVDNAKFSYAYQYEKDNTINSYAASYSFVFVEYVDNISRDTYQVNAGFKVAFDNIFDISTWKAPTNIKSHLSELHKFESITFDTNMQLQSTAGVQKTQAAIDRDNTPNPVNHAPEWTQSTYDTGLTVKCFNCCQTNPKNLH
ncbi:hypothetical protein [Sulfurimonas sp. NWX79]|uniref:hypothetical protein n=1 Tax=Sulfurimonas sp. NWX79 TaxID=2925412 RepID=UPI003204917E